MWTLSRSCGQQHAAARAVLLRVLRQLYRETLAGWGQAMRPSDCWPAVSAAAGTPSCSNYYAFILYWIVGSAGERSFSPPTPPPPPAVSYLASINGTDADFAAAAAAACNVNNVESHAPSLEHRLNEKTRGRLWPGWSNHFQ